MKISKVDMLSILNWLETESLFQENVKFKYEHLIDKCYDPETGEVFEDIEVEEFDIIMFELYNLYSQFKNTDIIEKIKTSPLMSIFPALVETSQKSVVELMMLFEKYMFEYDFEYARMMEIQKIVLPHILNDAILTEDFEKCSKIRDKINKIK